MAGLPLQRARRILQRDHGSPVNRLLQRPIQQLVGSCSDPWPVGLAAVVAVALIGPAAGRAESWKNCSFNDRPIPCRDSHSPDGTVRIVWKDGQAMTYRLVKEGFPISTLRDSLGGIWEREVFIQGNAVFTNRANGNRIFLPLR